MQIKTNGLTHVYLRLEQAPAKVWVLAVRVIIAVLYGLTIWRVQSADFDGRRVFWLQDDMLISMRYARNWAQGEGLVWNPGGERVEGYSNLGWVAIMAAVHRLPLPNTLTSLPILAINVGLALLVLGLTARLMLWFEPAPGLALPAALLGLGLCYDLARWAILGLETTLQTVVFLWLILRVLNEIQAGQVRPLTFVLAGLLGVIRADGFLLAGCLVLLAWFGLPGRRGRVLLWGMLALLLPLLQIGFRLIYYGAPLPNTYYLKLTGWGLLDRWPLGLRFVYQALRAYGPLVAAAGLGAWLGRERRTWLAVLGLGAPLLAYGLYTGGDDFGGARFLAPWLPGLFALAFLAPRRMLAPGLAVWRVAGPGLLLAAVVLLARFNFLQGRSVEAPVVRAGLLLQQATLPETRIAIFPAGALAYFSEREAVDLLGKNDARLGRSAAHPEIAKPGHNKFDFAYSLGELKPDLVVALFAPAYVAEAEQRQALLAGSYAYGVYLYLDPVFQQQYAASLVYLDRMAVFVRQDSPEQARLMTGDCSPVTQPGWLALGLKTACRR
jgi:hypothetical protein